MNAYTLIHFNLLALVDLALFILLFRYSKQLQFRDQTTDYKNTKIYMVVNITYRVAGGMI